MNDPSPVEHLAQATALVQHLGQQRPQLVPAEPVVCPHAAAPASSALSLLPHSIDNRLAQLANMLEKIVDSEADVKERVTAGEGDVKEVKEDVEEVEAVKEDVEEVKKDVEGVNEDVKGVKKGLENLHDQVANQGQNIDLLMRFFNGSTRANTRAGGERFARAAASEAAAALAEHAQAARRRNQRAPSRIPTLEECREAALLAFRMGHMYLPGWTNDDTWCTKCTKAKAVPGRCPNHRQDDEGHLIIHHGISARQIAARQALRYGRQYIPGVTGDGEFCRGCEATRHSGRCDLHPAVPDDEASKLVRLLPGGEYVTLDMDGSVLESDEESRGRSSEGWLM